MQVVYPVGRKYASAPSAPRLKLVSTPELKSLFSTEDVKLPSWLDGMWVNQYIHSASMLYCCIFVSVFSVSASYCISPFEGAWPNIFPIWKSLLRNRSAAFAPSVYFHSTHEVFMSLSGFS